MRIGAFCVTGLAAVLSGCGGTQPADNQGVGMPAADGPANAASDARAVANLRTAQGAAAGSASATADARGIRLVLRVEGLPPGRHGVHVHMTGRCEPPGFESAGGHWNPAARQHGLESPRGAHAGDMPNLTISADGRGSLDYAMPNATLAGLLAADGSAIVVHASADDQRTDPSGNSGDRIACGTFGSG